MTRHHMGTARRLAIATLAAAGLSGCATTPGNNLVDRTLVYGERSGVNIALRSDPAKSRPVEVNVGIQRRVSTVVPATARDAATGRPSAEAASMVSSFDLAYSNPRANDGVFGGCTRIATVFATGAAATALATAINAPGGSAESLADGITAGEDYVGDAAPPPETRGTDVVLPQAGRGVCPPPADTGG